MTLEEAIHHARMTAETREDLCEECRKEHLQLADWLEELKESREIINRQETEIERLQADKIIAERHEKDARELFKNTVLQLETAESEAIKEFAERLKARICKDIDAQGMFPLPYTKKAYDTVMVFVDNLVKEMTEVQE